MAMYRLHPWVLFFTFLVFIPVIMGCSFYADFYLVNKTDKPVVTTIKLDRTLTEWGQYPGGLQFRYTTKVISITNKTTNELNSKLPFTVIDDRTISFTLPPQTTLLVGGTYNQSVALDSIHFLHDHHAVKYNAGMLQSKLKRTGGLTPPFHFTYYIE